MRESPILLVDGVCNLCNGFVRFVADTERAPVLRFAALQSEVGRTLLAAHRLRSDRPESVVLLDGDGAHTRSEAALRVTRYLRQPWRSAWHLRWIPRWLRDRIYDFVAARRYGWFGRQDVCTLPRADLASRFLDLS